jgi:predicted metal-dependent HD superfamily phosphohydrolase
MIGMGTTWTKLEGTMLWQLAKDRHDADKWRTYHGFNHPLFMYEKAKRIFDFDYCQDLDVAILTHDVINDGLHPEIGSWDWLRGVCDQLNENYDTLTVRHLIETTIDHRPGRDNRLILLDLSGFMSDVRREHTEALREEARRKNGTTDEAFAAGTEAYLTGLLERIEDQLDDPVVPRGDVEYFRAICDGIRGTISEIDGSGLVPVV